MARLTDNDRKLILADYHTGHYTQRELANKYKVSTATINKSTKGHKPKNLTKVNAQVSINRDLMEQSEQEVNAFNEIVNIKTEATNKINNIGLKMLDKMDTMTDQIDTPTDMKAIADAVDRVSITLKVNERHAPKQVTAIQVNENKKDPVTGMKGLYGVLHE